MLQGRTRGVPELQTRQRRRRMLLGSITILLGVAGLARILQVAQSDTSPDTDNVVTQGSGDIEAQRSRWH
eukprot:3074081-Amphidinium_carterae.1